MNVKRSNQLFLLVTVFHMTLSLLVSALYYGLGFKMDSMVSSFLSELLILVPALVFLWIEKMDAQEKGQPVPKAASILRLKKIRFSTVLLVFVISILITPLVGLLNAISMMFVDNEVLLMNEQFSDMPWIFYFLIVGVAAPVCEEILFRGVIYRGLLKSGNVVKAAFWSALFFGLLHMNFNQAPYAFVLGAVMAILLETAGSLWAPILLHFFINSRSVFSLVILELASKLTGEEQLLEESLGMASDPALYRSSLMMTIPVFLVMALVMTPVIYPVLKAMAAREGRKEYVSWLFKERKTHKAKVLSWTGILAMVLCLAYMILTLFV